MFTLALILVILGLVFMCAGITLGACMSSARYSRTEESGEEPVKG